MDWTFDNSTFGADTFFTGEESGSNVTALKVSVKMVERTYTPVWLSKQNKNTFTGEMFINK